MSVLVNPYRFKAAGGDPVLAYIGATGFYSGGNPTQSVSFGPEASNRSILAIVATRGGYNKDLTHTGATIGGVSATLIGTTSGALNHSTLGRRGMSAFIARVPAGTSGNVQIFQTVSSSAQDNKLFIWSIADLESITPSFASVEKFDVDNARDFYKSINIPSGGVFITAQRFNCQEGQWNINAGATEDYFQLNAGGSVRDTIVAGSYSASAAEAVHSYHLRKSTSSTTLSYDGSAAFIVLR